MNKREMKYWAIVKWRMLSQDGHFGAHNFEKWKPLNDFYARCSYCQEYHAKGCGNCPLAKTHVQCRAQSSQYRVYMDSLLSTEAEKQAAKAMLDIIRTIPVPREPRFIRGKR